MNYSKIYNDLIESRKIRNSGEELHHIVPTCMGGGDEPENLVPLTLREHLVAHMLLAKMYRDNVKVLMAARLLYARIGYSHYNGRIKIPEIYYLDRFAVKSGFDSFLDMGTKMLNEFLSGMSTPRICDKYGVTGGRVNKALKYAAKVNSLEQELSSQRFKFRSENSSRTRENIKPEQEERRVQAVREALQRPEVRANMSKSKQGCNNPMWGKRFTRPKVQCPHCGKVGGNSTMYRWHMNNCKFKEKPNED